MPFCYVWVNIFLIIEDALIFSLMKHPVLVMSVCRICSQKGSTFHVFSQLRNKEKGRKTQGNQVSKGIEFAF